MCLFASYGDRNRSVLHKQGRDVHTLLNQFACTLICEPVHRIKFTCFMPFGIYSERIDRYSSVTNPSTLAIAAQQNSVSPFFTYLKAI